MYHVLFYRIIYQFLLLHLNKYCTYTVKEGKDILADDGKNGSLFYSVWTVDNFY